MADGRLIAEQVRSASPPTDRVVAIVEFLAAQDAASSVAAIAARLELNRATVTSILLALEAAGWVVRQPDLRYLLGPGLLGVAEAMQESLLSFEGFNEALARLTRRTGCGTTLALVGAAEMTFLSVVGGPGQIPAGVATGVRLPLKAPIGAAVVAHRDDRARAGWLASAEDSHRSAFEDVLEQVRKNGVAVFGLGDADPKVLDVLGEVAELLARHPQRGALRVRVFELLVGLGGTPYSAAQLADPGPLSISYLVAPIFDAEGRAMYELQLGPLRPEVSAAEREHYVQELKATAAQLSRH